MSERLLPDYFKVLEVHRNASPEVIEKAYKVLAAKYHPDRNPPERRTWATRRMQELNEAYQVLSNEKKKNAYLRERQYQIARMIYNEGLVGVFKSWLSKG